jgi:hypothetical protein
LHARDAHAASRNADALAFAISGGSRVIFDVADCVALEPLKVVAETRLNAPGI